MLEESGGFAQYGQMQRLFKLLETTLIAGIWFSTSVDAFAAARGKKAKSGFVALYNGKKADPLFAKWRDIQIEILDK